MLSVSTMIDRINVDSQTRTGGRITNAYVIKYINDFLKESRRKYMLPWARQTQQLLVFSDVIQYAAPSTMVAPIEPQKYPENDDTSGFTTLSQKEFVRNRESGNEFAVEWIKGTKFLNIRHTGGGTTLAHNMDDIDDNGTWTVASDGSNLVADTGIKRQGNASLRFDVTNSAGLVTLTNSGITSALNLAASTSTQNNTDFEQNSYVFLWLFIPTGASLTSIALRWGSSSSNFWESTAQTTAFDGSAFQAGEWNLIGFDWRTATQTGTVDETAVNYFQIRLTGASTATRWRVDNLIFRKWIELKFPFYSNQLVATDSTGNTLKEFVTVVGDYLLGDEDFLECAYQFILKQIAKYITKDKDLYLLADKDYMDIVASLRTRYPSMEAVPQTDYFPLSILRG